MKRDSFEFPEHVDAYLNDHNVLTLATAGEDGPWSAAVFFAHQGRHFYFMSDSATLHGQHIGQNGLVAAAIHEDYGAWPDIKGMQMRGRVWIVQDKDEWRAGLRTYFRKYDFGEAFFRGELPPALHRRLHKIRLFCFEPELILWLDNATGFGNRVQLYPAER